MNILFITATRIGDAVLSTGLLSYIEQNYPDAKVTIACGPLCAPLFEGYPHLQRILVVKKQKRHKHWFDLWHVVRKTRWDIVIDLRNSAVSRLIFAKKRYIFGNHIDRSQHKVEQNAAVMGLSPPPTPKLWFTDSQMATAREHIKLDGTPILAIGPTANWLAKTWPAERFIDIIQCITGSDGILPDARVAIFAAPGEEDVAYTVLNSVPVEKRIDMIAKTDIGVSAASISLCDLYIGNDSGLMHCAAAANIPTLGLFGPSYPHLYRPWGAHTQYVSTPETFDELINYQGYTAKTAPCLMESLSTDMVIEALKKMIAK